MKKKIDKIRKKKKGNVAVNPHLEEDALVAVSQKEIKLTYPKLTEKDIQTIRSLIIKMIYAASFEEAMKSYLQLISLYIPEVVDEALNTKIEWRGQMISLKEAPQLKAFFTKLDPLAIIRYEIIVPDYRNGGFYYRHACKYLGYLTSLNQQKQELEQYKRTRNTCQKINKACENGDVSYLESQLEFIMEHQSWYGWIIPYFAIEIEAQPDKEYSLTKSKENPKKD